MMAQPQLVSFHTIVTSSDWLEVKPSRTKDQSVDKKGREHAKKQNIQIPTLAKHPASYCRSSEIPESDEEWSKREEKKTLRTNLGPLWRVKKGYTAKSDQVVMTKCAEGEARERKKPASMKHLP